ncbi:MAG: glycogen synthase GlgA [Betaproteobacteria bacterium]|nr:glycogen synthase GlgA [Betaproteobacteria bacterium]
MKVLFVTPEYTSWIKTGGLGDVSAALPTALRELGIDARVVIPGYREVLAAIGTRPVAASLAPWSGFPGARLLVARTPHGTPAWVLDCPQFYDRDAGPYGDSDGRDFADNALRFGLLALAAARIGDGLIAEWKPEVVHGNDWQAALAPAYLRLVFASRVPCVQTVHNLAFQGLFPPDTATTLGLPHEGYAAEGFEFYGRLSFLKAGLRWADAITTVSPTYAREIQREPLGFGLQDLLASRRDTLYGITNGIDVEEWDPARDRRIASTYSAATLESKAKNKRALQRRLGLDPRGDVVLLGVVSRLTAQKGIDLVLEAVPRLLELPVQLAVLGTGERDFEQALAALARAHPDRIAARIGFDETLAHLIEAGTDIFLMPSRFEPCGLNQMYSQRYGTPPVVRRTGGLADTVVDCTPDALARGDATGFVFDAEDAGALVAAVERGLAAFGGRGRWRRLQENGMRRDFSWAAAARRYAEVYDWVVRSRGARAGDAA